MEEKSTIQSKDVGKLEVFFRLTRIQFIPLIILPASVGSTLAFWTYHNFNFLYFGLTLLGVILLHLGANAIDDCYDFQNGVDSIANTMFPKEFEGWKPLPRGLISPRNAELVSYLLFFGSLAIALYFSVVVGIWSLILGVSGILLAIIYAAPPFKLDYRGYGLGEASIFLAFGPIPVMGAFYVQTARLTVPALLVSLPIGLMTVTILMDHDLIFYEVYSAAKKLSLGTVLGRARTLSTSLALTVISYALVFAMVVAKVLPLLSVAAPIASALILLRKASTFRRSKEAPPFYAPFTSNALASNWVFSLVLALSLLLSAH